ncbi:MAG: hypothetical protein K0R38_6497 [Polyangiaceae bacterium]|jgi:hypothetical protein|nr:hypothetical protein [Polyangiaceae bacterium]
MPSLHRMRPGVEPHEHVGKLADGRQVLLTTRFGPVERADGEHTQLTLVVFDEDGAVVSSEWRVLGAAAELPEPALQQAFEAMLAPLGQVTSAPIDIQPVPLKLLGEPRPPLILTSEGASALSVTLLSDDGFFIPDWPFGDAG